jgi:hypothetical protein
MVVRGKQTYTIYYAVPCYFSSLYCNVCAERTLREDDRPLEILQEWGCHRDEVRFVLRYTVVPPSTPQQQQQQQTPRSSRSHQTRRGTHALAPRTRRHRNGKCVFIYILFIIYLTKKIIVVINTHIYVSKEI